MHTPAPAFLQFFPPPVINVVTTSVSGVTSPVKLIFHKAYTLPELNIAPENRPPEKEIPIGSHF